jgi:hypothetical protein
LWSLLVTVTKQGTGEVFENLDPSDFVTVKIGPTFTSLSTIGIFYNRINPVTGTVLYDVKHLYKGASFAFRFEFSSSTKDDIFFCSQYNLNLKYGSPCSVGHGIAVDHNTEFNDIYGNVWQWIDNEFYPLPNFKSHYLYKDFSLPYFTPKAVRHLFIYSSNIFAISVSKF